jgi:hypothetical protein
MKKIYARALAFLSVDHPSPGLKQLPLVVAFAISLIVLVFVPDIQITSMPLLIAGIALMVVATIFAALCTRYPRLVCWTSWRSVPTGAAPVRSCRFLGPWWCSPSSGSRQSEVVTTS